jgi:hypothetical protein
MAIIMMCFTIALAMAIRRTTAFQPVCTDALSYWSCENLLDPQGDNLWVWGAHMFYLLNAPPSTVQRQVVTLIFTASDKFELDIMMMFKLLKPRATNAHCGTEHK